MITIPLQINTELSTRYESLPQTVTQLASSSVSVSAGTIVVNGVDTLTTTATVSSTDLVSIGLTSAPSYITPTFSVLSIDGAAVGVFEVITKDAVDTVYDPKYASLYPVLDTSSTIESFPAYTPTPNKVLSVIDVATNTVTSSLDLNVLYDGVTPVGYNPIASLDYEFIVDYYSNSILRADIYSGVIVESIVVGSGPYAIGSSLGPGGRSVIYITNSKDNTVSVLDINTYQESFTIPVGLKPTNIINDINNDMWVVNSQSQYLTKIVTDPLNIPGYTLENISIGYHATDITATDTHIYVTCIEDNLVLRIDILDNSVVEIPVGRNPLGISTDVIANVYVVNSYDGTVSVIDTASASIIDTVYVGKYPAFIVSDLSSWWVVDLYSNTVSKYRAQINTLEVTIPVPANPVGLDFGQSGQLCVSSLYDNLSSRFVARDSIVKDFTFTSVVNVPTSSLVISDPYIILGITYDVPVTINPLSDLSTILVKNGIDVGVSTTVALNDILQVKITSLSGYRETNSATITIGSSVESFSVTTIEVDDIPDFFEFYPANSVQPNATVVSNTVTIAGLSPNFTLPITLTSGVFILNGIDVGASTAIATGDTLAISVQSSPDYCGVVEAYIDSPTFDSNFVVSTVQSPSDLVLQEALKLSNPIDYANTTYIPQTAGNISVIDSATDVVTVQPNYYPIPSLSIPNPSTVNDGLSYDFVPLLFDNVVLRLDRVSNAIVQTIALNRPYSVSSEQLNPTSPILVSQPDDNVIAVIHPTQYTVDYTIALPSPTVIRESSVVNEFIVLYDSNLKLARVQLNATSGQYQLASFIQLSVEAIDFILVGNTAYVTQTSTDIVTAIDVDTLVSTQIPVGKSPWAITSNATDIFVTCGYNSELVRIDIATSLVVSTDKLPETLPLSVAATDTSVFVGYLESNLLSHIDIATGTIVSAPLLDASVPVSGMYLAKKQGNNIICLSAYGDLGPSRLTPSIHTPSVATFDFPTTLTSQEFTRTYSQPAYVQGLTRPTAIRVGNVFQSELIINDVVQTGNAGTISNGDYVKLSAISPVAGSAGMQIPVMVCSGAYTWTVNSQPDYIPSPFAFIPKVEAYASTEYESSTITVSGVTPDLLIPIIATVTPATLVRVNGTILSGTDSLGNIANTSVGIDPNISVSFAVHLGDTISIIGSSGVYDSTRAYTLDIEGVSADFNISTFSILNGIKRSDNNLGGRGKYLQLSYTYTKADIEDYYICNNLFASTDTVFADKTIPLPTVPTIHSVTKIETPQLLSPTLFGVKVLDFPLPLQPTLYAVKVLDFPLTLLPTIYDINSRSVPIADLTPIKDVTSDRYLPVTDVPAKFHLTSLSLDLRSGSIQDKGAVHYLSRPTVEDISGDNYSLVDITLSVALNRSGYISLYNRVSAYRYTNNLRTIGTSVAPRDIHSYMGVDWALGVYKHTFARAHKILKHRISHAFRTLDSSYDYSDIPHWEYVAQDIHTYTHAYNVIDSYLWERILSLASSVQTTSDSRVAYSLHNSPTALYDRTPLLSAVSMNSNSYEYLYFGIQRDSHTVQYSKTALAPRTVIPNPALILKVNTYSIARNIFYKTVVGSKSPGNTRTVSMYANQWDIFDYPTYTCNDHGYFGTPQLAIIDSFLQQGLDSSAIQTYEIVPGCYVWAQYVAQPSLCVGSSQFTRIAGWIKGG